MNTEDALKIVDESLRGGPDTLVLSDVQESVFRFCWEGRSYANIAETLGYDSDYVKKIGSQLWQSLSQVLGEKVSKKNLHSVLRQYKLTSQDLKQDSTQNLMGSGSPGVFQDWGEAIHVHDFWGRCVELETLKDWVIGNHCHVISILGQGGIGKTALSVKLIEQVQDQFKILIWRSLRQAPACEDLLSSIFSVLPHIQGAPPSTFEDQVSYLVQYLLDYPCLLVLDNLEAVLQQGKPSGQYREHYQSYQHFLERLCDGRHQSCVIITSREKPEGLSIREGELLTVRSFRLQGLSTLDGQQILQAKGLNTTATDSEQIVHKYAGNPLALKVVASSIQSIFGGDVSLFLSQGVTVFGNLWDLLQQQLNRLSSLEKQVMYWLTINREWVTLVELQDDLFPKVPQRDLITTLTSLQDRSLIETQKTGFTQQSVVMEYITDKLIDVFENELIEQNFEIFKSHAILKAQTKDYIRDTQTRLILKPLLERFSKFFNHPTKLEFQLKQMLYQLRNQSPKRVGYAGGNLLNLLCQAKANLKGDDLSHLILWQSYLPHTNMSQVNLTHSNLEKSIFAEAFGGITAVAFSPNGLLLATGDTAGGIYLWQARTGKKLAIFKGHQFWIWSLQFSPDSKTLVSTGDDYLVKLWDVNTQECLRIFKGHELTVVSGKFNASGEIIASSSQDETIRIWDLHRPETPCIQVLKGHRHRVSSVSFSPTEELLASGAEDNLIKLWNPYKGLCLSTLEGHDNWIKSVAFSPDGQLLASGGFDKSIKIWDVQTGKCLKTLQGHTQAVTTVVFKPDGRHLASSSYDQTIKIWDINRSECLRTFRGHSNRIWTLAYAPSGEQIVSGGDDHSTKFWVEKTGRCFRTIYGHTNITLSVDLHPNLKYFASGHEDQTVRLWNYQTGQLIKTFHGHTNRVWSVAFSPSTSRRPSNKQRKILASGSSDSTVRLWDYESGHCLRILHGHQSWVWSVAFSPNSNLVASSGYDQTIKLWDVQTGHCLQTYRGHAGPVSSVKFSPDGKEIVTSSFDYTVKRWDVESGECLCTFGGHTNNVWSITFSPDGKTVASSSYDATIKLWDISTGVCLQTLQGHQGPVIPIYFMPDGVSLISGSYDRTIKLWDLQTGQCKKTLSGHTDVVVSLSFTAQSLPSIISGSFDETIRVWNLDSGLCSDTLRVPRPYENMNILGITGVTTAQKETLKALGAVEKS